MRLLFLTFVMMTITNIAHSNTLFGRMVYQYQYANKEPSRRSAPAPYQSVFLDTRGENKINAWVFKHPDQETVRPTFVYFHGNAVNIAVLHKYKILDLMSSMNANFIVYDYPKYGLSTGEVNQETIVEAGQKVIDYAQKEFPNSKLYLWGRSIGTGPAVQLAKTNQSKLAGLILVSPFNYAWKLITTNMWFIPGLLARKLTKHNRWLSARAAKEINIPTLIVHGKKDDVIRYKLGNSLYKKFPEGKARLETLSDTRHNDIFKNKLHWMYIEEFLHRQ